MFLSAASEASNVLDGVLDAGISAAVGLAVGVIAFPVRWYLQWVSRRRQENVAAYRDALRTLRSAQRELRYTKVDSEEYRNREAIPSRVWEEMLHRLAEAPDGSTYRVIERLAGLSAQSRYLSMLFPPEAGEDPRGEIAEYAASLLTHKLKHRWKRPNDIERRLTEISSSTEWAEGELDSQYKQQVDAYAAWVKERSASEGGERTPPGTP